MRIAALIALLVGGCSFSPGAISTLSDAAPDGPPPITVGFAKTATMTDESVPLTQVRVLLSKPADADITVAFAVTGGTANRPNDYLLSDGTLTFAPNEVEKTISITVGADADAEPDETIVLELSDAMGPGAVLINTTHTVTISANTLPRVTFAVPTSSAAAETASPTIDVVLDKASQLTTNVDIKVMSGSATGGGTDYTLVTTTVTFDPGETTQPVTLSVVNDTLDEPTEDVTLLLADPTNIVLGTETMHTHTINDEDAPPTVAFDVTASSVGEGGTMIDLAVSLSAVSGKSFDVPFTIGGTSTATTDYTVVTATPIAFPAGTQTQNIRINIVQDTMVEASETIVVTLGTPNPAANATLGANTTHTVTISDDDTACLGTGNYTLCFTPPTLPVTVSGAINTDTSTLCSAMAPTSGWTGGPSSCFVVATDITVAATQVTGSKPLVLYATGSITVTGDLDVASHRGGTTGPGANTPCSAYTDAPANSTSGAGGGAGGTFRTTGGDGGEGNSANNTGGSAPAAGGAPTVLRGGCAGQKGGNGFGGTGNNGGDPGAGGGAVYLVTGGSLTINSGVTINASGAGADALATPDAGFFAGGGGGGSGGMIKLHAASFSVSGARLMANGGGGSSGADGNTAGTDGFDPSPLLPSFGGAPGVNIFAGATGGTGFGTSSTGTDANNGGSNQGGGGGGGGGGFIASNIALADATVSAGDIDP